MAIRLIDASSSGLAPGSTSPGDIDAIQLPASALVEIYNRGTAPLWFSINPAGNTFELGAIGSQVCDPGEYIEWPVSGSPMVCVRAAGGAPSPYQVRRIG